MFNLNQTCNYSASSSYLSNGSVGADQGHQIRAGKRGSKLESRIEEEKDLSDEEW